MNQCTLQNISWPFADSFDLSADAPDSSAQTELILQVWFENVIKIFIAFLSSKFVHSMVQNRAAIRGK